MARRPDQPIPSSRRNPTPPPQRLRRPAPRPPLHVSPPPQIVGAGLVQAPHRMPPRSDLAVYLYPGLTGARSISHVLRNIALPLVEQHRVMVGWNEGTRGDEKPLCASYLGRTEPFEGMPPGDFAAFTWGANQIPVRHERERGHLSIGTSDHAWAVRDETVEFFNSERISVMLVLSPTCRDVFVEAGVDPEKIVLLPLGVDPRVYRPDGPAAPELEWSWLNERAPEPGAFTFLVAGAMQARKGCAATVEAFCQAFEGRRDVALIIKNLKTDWSRDERGVLGRILERYPAAAPIGYACQTLSEWEMAALIREAGCLINAHYREGFGLMPLQAMACGTPTIVTDYHGPRQYATTANCYLLPVAREELCHEKQYERQVMWGRYDLEVLAELMRAAAAGERRGEIVTAGRATAAQWTWDRTAEVFLQTVEERIGHVQRRPRKWFSPQVAYTVTMPVRHGLDRLATTLRTLYELSAPPEVLVYSDANPEAEAEQIRELCGRYPRCRVLWGQQQVGCHEARRRLYEAARGEFIVSVDADVDFSETRADWFETLRDLWRERGRGIMHPLLSWPMKPKGMRTVQSAGGILQPGQDPPAVHRLRAKAVTEPEVLRPCEVMYGCGAFQFFHASLLDVIVMDGAYFPANWGDVDFCYRARAAGYPVWYCPEVRVTHNANAWVGSPEGREQSAKDKSGERFAVRWMDMALDDVARQDDTGALV